jgi:ADYC domain
MANMREIYVLMGIVGLFAVGCIEPPADPQTSEAVGEIKGCGDEDCGNGNSPKFESKFAFLELNWRMNVPEPYSGRGYVIYKIERMPPAPAPQVKKNCTLQVKHAHVEFLCEDNAQTIVPPNELKTVVVWVKSTVGVSEVQALQFEVEGQAPFWPTPKSSNIPQTFWYSVKRNATALDPSNPQITGWKDLCSNPPTPHQAAWTGISPTALVVFEGDRIDPKQRAVRPDTAGGWFTLACLLNNPMKMHMSGLSTAGSWWTAMDTNEIKQSTFVKAMSANYSGPKGKNWTLHGHPVQWSIERLPYSQPAVVHIEARWNEKGATCLSLPTGGPLRGPRVGVHQTTESLLYFDATLDDIVKEIQMEYKKANGVNLPDCLPGQTGENDPAGSFMVTANAP